MKTVRSAFQAQLATVMDSLLAAAVCEIAKIFESSLCEQQAGLAQKTEEISILRGRLEKVERRRKVGGSEEGELSSGDREGSTGQQTPNISGNTAHMVFKNFIKTYLGQKNANDSALVEWYHLVTKSVSCQTIPSFFNV